MRIFLQNEDAFDLYTLNAGALTRQRYFYDLPTLLRHCCETMQGCSAIIDDVFLLHESYFDCMQFHIELTTHEAFSIHDLKGIIRQKVSHMKTVHGISSLYCKHRINGITVDGKPSSYLLGKQGDISFFLQFFVLKIDALSAFKIRLPDHTVMHTCAIYPKHLFLLERMKKNTVSADVPLLFVGERTTTLLRTTAGRYTNVDEIGMGESLLKSCYQEHNVVPYFHQGFDVVEHNTLLKKLVNEALQFYTHQLCQRVHQFVLPGQQVRIAGNVLLNPLFFSAFQEELKTRSNGFALPLLTLAGSGVEGYQPADLPVVAYVAMK